MTTFLLIRHGLCEPVGTAISGRAPGIHLNAEGQAQAARLAERLADVPLAAVYSSPMERAVETAGPIAARQGLAVDVVPELTELDFGDWTGRTLAELEGMDRWREFNGFRSGTQIPGGELMADVQARAVKAFNQLSRKHPDATVATVSHGDVIRSALMYFLGAPLDLLQRIEVDPASVSVLRIDPWGPTIVRINMQ